MIDSKAREKSYYIPKHITKNQSKDTGVLMALICLLLGYFGHHELLITLSIALMIIVLILPTVFFPFAKVWFGASNMLGTIVSGLLLSAVFLGMVVPMAMIRRILGIDTLQLKKWKKQRDSVFKVRNHTFEPKELEKPY